MEWRTIERPGYFGSHRDQQYEKFDLQFGTDGWRLRWQTSDQDCDATVAALIYEDSYHDYLIDKPELLEWLLAEASDVYDDAPSNVASGLDYTVQETNRTHWQDIALRRCIARLGRRFYGSRHIQIRDLGATPPIHPLSIELSPGRVPFHRPLWILRPELEGWWEPGTVESWYQSNKLLQIKSP